MYSAAWAEVSFLFLANERKAYTTPQTIIIIIRIFIVMLPYFRFSWDFIYCELKSAFVRCTREWKIMEQKEVKFELSLRFVTINNVDGSAKHAAKREQWTFHWIFFDVKSEKWKKMAVVILEIRTNRWSWVGSGFYVIEIFRSWGTESKWKTIFSTTKM